MAASVTRAGNLHANSQGSQGCNLSQQTGRLLDLGLQPVLQLKPDNPEHGYRPGQGVADNWHANSQGSRAVIGPSRWVGCWVQASKPCFSLKPESGMRLQARAGRGRRATRARTCSSWSGASPSSCRCPSRSWTASSASWTSWRASSLRLRRALRRLHAWSEMRGCRQCA